MILYKLRGIDNQKIIKGKCHEIVEHIGNYNIILCERIFLLIEIKVRLVIRKELFPENNNFSLFFNIDLNTNLRTLKVICNKGFLSFIQAIVYIRMRQLISFIASNITI